MSRLSLRARLTLWYLAALLVSLSLLGLVVVWQQGRIGLRRVDRELDDATATLVNMMRDELGETASPSAAALEVERLMAAPGRAVAILDGSGRTLAANWNGLTLPADFPGADGPQTWTADTPRGSWRIHADLRTLDGSPFRLLVAAPLADVLRERREAQEAMWIGIPLALLLAAGGGWWLASVGLRPITEMAGRAAALAPAGMDDLGQSERRDEIGQLARAFNGLVARLRQTLQTQRRFMADASHELRTPVSVMQSAADVTLARDGRSEGEYRDALDIVAVESRRLGRLVEDMLVLARADAGGYPLRRVGLYLDELVAECVRTMEVVGRERCVTILLASAGEIPFTGDEDLLRRGILNLVQNAVQHTRQGGVVCIEVSSTGGEIAIRIKDQGPGVPEGDRERIFSRFVQLDPSRRASGAGLGLPIARWIAETHGGTVTLDDSSPNGSTFVIRLHA
jgi:heavy metal sensor kinase